MLNLKYFISMGTQCFHQISSYIREERREMSSFVIFKMNLMFLHGGENKSNKSSIFFIPSMVSITSFMRVSIAFTMHLIT